MFSKIILDLKDMYLEAINYFVLQLDPILNRGIMIVVVPSHSAYMNVTGIGKVAFKLAARGRIFAIDALIRAKEIEKLSRGVNRSINTHLDSTKVKRPELIREGVIRSMSVGFSM